MNVGQQVAAATDNTRAGWRSTTEYILVACCLMLLIVLLQNALGAYNAEFESDESSHYVSGLFIHDYISAHAPGSPLDFIQRFHSSYPVVGIGHWGPLYYVAEGVWMLLFGWSRSAMLLLSASVTCAAALILYGIAAPRFGRVTGGLTAVAFVASPLVQEGSAGLMLDGPVALLCLLALLAYWRYLDTRQARYALLFGLVAAAGLLIKRNAGCLALVPVFALLIGRDWRAPRRWSFWLPALVVIVLTAPWYVLTYGLVAAGFRFTWGWDYISVAVPANLGILLEGVGPLLLAAGVGGFLAICRRPRPGPDSNLMVVAAALFAAVLTFQSVVPAAIQDRYLAPALPPLLLLAVNTVWHAVTRWFGMPRERAAAIAVGLLCLAALPSVVDVAPKRQLGLMEAAREVWKRRLPNNPSILIVADGAGEGAAVAELAMDDPARPSLFAVRGSRLLGGGGYNNQDYLPRFHAPGEVMAAIDDYAIPLVLVRGLPGHNPWLHIDQVEQARALQPDRWELLYRGDADGIPVELFRIRGNAGRNADIDRLRALSAPRALSTIR